MSRGDGLSPPTAAAGIGASCAGVLAVLAALTGPLTPDIHPPPPTHPSVRPAPSPTAHHGAPGTTPVDPTTLIIQQNPHCWIGVPGITCGPERTYA